MKHASFEVVVSDYSVSVDEWRRAQEVRRSDLPELNQEQKEVARKFGVTEEEYARGVLAGLYGRERMSGRAQGLGEEVNKILEGLGPDHRVLAVVAEMFKGRWILRIQTPEKVVNVAIPRELADDVLDSGAVEDFEKLKTRVLSDLGKNEQAVRR